ncbi:hypothetical protein IV203_004979 [Nitzschia inconspicua]|uniref:MRPL25 domain-containing protein n=1 Tax=Nitzschia inconspicua TaxID=303405 RepID=A0A9K3PFQ7_9STRA|nr:hypothetical protein IV203_004979 [Nitzschia inconspicua]
MTMRAALRHLCQHGVEALTPTKKMSKAVTVGSYVAKPSRVVWHRPLVSKRVGNDLRKEAIRQGTYGSFDSTTGVGWEPSWDLVLHSNRHQSSRIGNIQPSKKTAKERSREDRALKLEENLAGQAQAMEDYYAEKEKAKVLDNSFEARYKRMMRGGAAGGGR